MSRYSSQTLWASRKRAASLVVLPQLREHIERFDIVRIFVEYALQTRGLTRRTDRDAASQGRMLGASPEPAATLGRL